MHPTAVQSKPVNVLTSYRL